MGDQDPKRDKGKEKAAADEDEEIADMVRAARAFREEADMGDQDPKRDKGKEKAAADEEEDEEAADMVREMYDSSWLPGLAFGSVQFQLQPMGSLPQVPPPPAEDDLGKNAWRFPFPPPPVLNWPSPTDVGCPVCGGPPVCGCWEWDDQGNPKLQFSFQGNPTQNAPPPRSAAPVVNQLQASLMGQQQLHGSGAVGGSSSSLQAPASGNMALQLRPMGFLQQGTPPPQLQPTEFSREAWEWGAKMARRIMTGRPGGSGFPGNPGQNAPRSAAPVVNQPQASLMGQQHGGGALGGNSGSMQASGNMALQPRPMGFLQQGPPPPQLQLTEFSPEAWEWGAKMARRIMAGRPGGSGFPGNSGHQQPPQVQGAPIPIRGPEQTAVPDLPPPPPPVGAAVQQLQNQLGEAPGGYIAQLGDPVPPADQSGPGPGPDNEGLRCSACRYYPVPAKEQPRWHICVCSCRSREIFCSVCYFGP